MLTKVNITRAKASPEGVFMIKNKKGLLLIVILLIISGLSITVMLTIPREALTLSRQEEQTLIDSLMSVENSINSALRRVEFKEMLRRTVGRPPAPTPPFTTYYMPEYFPTPAEDLTQTFWKKTLYGSYILDYDESLIFLDNLTRLGYLVERMYYPPPVLKNKNSRWRVMISEKFDYSELYQYNPYP